MSRTEQTVTLRVLLGAYLESLRPQIHEVMVEHNQRILAAFEAALQVRVPRRLSDVPSEWSPLFMLFQSTVDSIPRVRAPLAEALEAGLIFSKLEAAGDEGAAIHDELQRASGSAQALRESQLTILERTLRVFLGGAQPSATMDAVRATGIYPGDSPRDFDIFDHI
jgi:hypothetical protein